MWMVWLAGTARAADGITPEQLDAILTFRAQHLEVREVRTVIPGTITLVHSGWGWGPPGPWRYGTTEVRTTPAEVHGGWTVYEGPRPLTVPEYLRIVDRSMDADALEGKIRRSHTTGGVFAGLGVVGVGAGAAGLVGAVESPADARTWTGVAIGGLGLAVIGAVASSGENDRAERLAHEFPKSQDLTDVQGQVREYDETLRQDLGLTPEQAYRELERPRRNPPAAPGS